LVGTKFWGNILNQKDTFTNVLFSKRAWFNRVVRRISFAVVYRMQDLEGLVFTKTWTDERR
jgi:hypothetical protein